MRVQHHRIIDRARYMRVQHQCIIDKS